MKLEPQCLHSGGGFHDVGSFFPIRPACPGSACRQTLRSCGTGRLCRSGQTKRHRFGISAERWLVYRCWVFCSFTKQSHSQGWKRTIQSFRGPGRRCHLLSFNGLFWPHHLGLFGPDILSRGFDACQKWWFYRFSRGKGLGILYRSFRIDIPLWLN